jgi:spermidine/putrescine transport system permease protein
MQKRRGTPLTFYYWFLLLLLYLPIGVLFLFSVNNGVVFVFPLKGLTPHWYRDMLKNVELLQSLRNSALVALSSSALATALGTLAAIALLRFQFRGKAGFLAVALTPLLVPFIILGVALLVLFSMLGISRSLWTVAAAHTVVSLPYTLLVVMARLVGFDPRLEEAAQDLGATYPYTLRRIILPLLAPSVLAAWLVAFTVSFDEFVLASFLIGRDPTLPVYLFSQLRFANRFPQVVALAVTVMLVSLGLVLLAEWLQRRGAETALNLRAGQNAPDTNAGEIEYPIEGIHAANKP